MSTLYSERASLTFCKVVLALYALGMVALFAPRVADGTFAPSDLVLVPAFGLLALPLAIVGPSKRRYNSIDVTTDELHVGRAHVPWSQVARDRLTEDLTRTPAGESPKVLGGSFASPLGWREVYLPMADGTTRTVATKRPAELVAAVREAARA